MPDIGMQVVRITHQDAGVWADLGSIRWAAGLRVRGARNIVTETGSERLQLGIAMAPDRTGIGPGY
jgi:hypothetical protein